MKPAKFEYHAPETVADVVSLLAEHGDDAKVLAGGQSLVPMLNMRLTRFEHIIDLNRVAELRGIQRANGTLDDQGDDSTGRGRARHHGGRRPAARPGDPADRPLPDPEPRHDRRVDRARRPRVRASRGCARARRRARSRRPERFTRACSRRSSSSGRGPRPSTTTRSSRRCTSRCGKVAVGFVVDEVARRSGDFALTGVVCGVEVDDAGAVNRSAIAFFGMAPTPMRARQAEAALCGTESDDAGPRRDRPDSRWRIAIRPTTCTRPPVPQACRCAPCRRALGRALGDARSG